MQATQLWAQCLTFPCGRDYDERHSAFEEIYTYQQRVRLLSPEPAVVDPNTVRRFNPESRIIDRPNSRREGIPEIGTI